MRRQASVAVLTVAALVLCLAGAIGALAQSRGPTGPQSRFAEANGLKLHYLTAGTRGTPIILLHGFAQTSHMWQPVMEPLSRSNIVIAPDLRGFGASSIAPRGYDKKTMAQDIHALAETLGHKKVRIVGHDIGLMVAYAYAAQYPAEVDRIVLMDAFLPGIGDWNKVWLQRDLWHFHFHGEIPLKLVAGRERIYLDHFWNDFAADRNKSVSERDRRVYAKAYAQTGAMEAGFEVFKAFERDAADFKALSQTKLKMPMLVLAGEKASGGFLIEQAKMVADNVTGVVVPGAGHWLIDEARTEVVKSLVSFLAR